MIRNDIQIPRLSSRMISRIVQLQHKGKHHHRSAATMPRNVPFWASAKTISVRDICGNTEEDYINDDSTEYDDDFGSERPTTIYKSKYSFLGQLNEWDTANIKSEYAKYESASYYAQLSDTQRLPPEFDQISIGCSKIFPTIIQKTTRKPLMHSKHIDPSSRSKKAVRVVAKKVEQIVKEDSATTLQELDEYIDRQADEPAQIDEEIEDGLSDYRQLRNEFIGKRCIKLDRDIHTSSGTKGQADQSRDRADHGFDRDLSYWESTVDSIRSFQSEPLKRRKKVNKKRIGKAEEKKPAPAPAPAAAAPKKEDDPIKVLEKKLEKVAPLVFLQDRLKMPGGKVQIVFLLAISFVYSILTLLNFYGEYLTNTLAFVYPSYQSMKAIEEGEKGHYKHWLAFWVVFGVIQQSEYLLGIPLLFRLFPLYYFLKSVVLVWLMAPSFRGALWMWNAVMHLSLPLLKKNIAAHFHQPEKKPAKAPEPEKKPAAPEKKLSFLEVAKEMAKVSYSR